MIIKSGAWVEINLNNIGYNLNEIKKRLDENMKVCCVVKANAYGCGAVEVAKYLQNNKVDFFAVARIEEALELRNNNIKLPILCLGYTDISMIKEAIQKDIAITLYDVKYAKAVNEIAKQLNKKTRVHIKLDTGMSRLGFLAEDAIEPIKEINKLDNIYIEGIYTHFAKADEKDKTTTKIQLSRYKKVIDSLENLNINIPIKHVANSAAILDLENDLFNMVRQGIILYGYYPSDEVKKDISLRPCLKLKSAVTNVKILDENVGISYGHVYKTSEKCKIVTVSIGYADGFNRNQHNISLRPCLKLKSAVTNVKILDENVGISYGHVYKTSEKCKIVTVSIGYADGFNRNQHNPKVSIKGRVLDVVGRICMDQCMVKAPLDMDIEIGDEVITMDNDIKELSAEECAKRNKTINYEVLCMINRRVTRVYKDNDKEYSVNYLLK